MIEASKSTNYQPKALSLFDKKETEMPSLKRAPNALTSGLKVYALRLKPNQDLHKELEAFVRENDLKAAFVMTCVGSLTRATIRLAYSGMYKNEVIFCLLNQF